MNVLDCYPEEYNILSCKISFLENGKKDIIFLEDWKKYQNEKYPRNLINSNSSNFYVICGQISNNLIVFDFDVVKKKECNSEEIYGKIIEIEPRFKEALTIQTQSGGLHFHVQVESMDCYNMLSRNKDIPCNLEEIDHIDVQGEKKIAILWTKIINQEKPLKITNSEFYEILGKFKGKEEKALEVPKKEVKTTINNIDLNKLDKPYRDFLNGKFKIDKYCEKTGIGENQYWKDLYWHVLKRLGLYHYDLYPILEKTQPEFSKEKTEAQLKYKYHDYRLPFNTKSKPGFIKKSKYELYPEYYKETEEIITDREKLRKIYQIQTGKRATWIRDGKEFSTNDFSRWEAKVKGKASEETVKRQEEQIVEELIDEFDLLVLDDTKQILVREYMAYLFEMRNFEDELKSKIFRIEKGSYSNVKKDILAMIKDDKRVRVKRDEFYNKTDIIPFKNGVYDFKTDYFFKIERVKDFKFFYEISHDYREDKEYKCLKFKKILVQWIDKKTKQYHRKGKRKFLLNDIFEAIGLTMTMNTGFKKHFIPLGPTDAGKTQFGNIRNALFDNRNMVGSSLQRIGSNEFGTDNLQFKVALACDELPEGLIKQTGPIKNLLGGTTLMQGELKGGKKFLFKPYVKCWFNANKPAELKNPNDPAFYNRFIFIFFPNEFKQGDKTFTNDIWEDIVNDDDEMQGIIHEAIEGYKRILERKGFRKEVTENTRHIWLYNSDPIYKFLHNYTDKDDEYHGKITAKDFLEKFAVYGNVAWSAQKVYVRLNQYGVVKYMGDEFQKLRGIKWKEGVWDDENNKDEIEKKKEKTPKIMDEFFLKEEPEIIEQPTFELLFTPEEKELIKKLQGELDYMKIPVSMDNLWVTTGADKDFTFPEFEAIIEKLDLIVEDEEFGYKTVRLPKKETQIIEEVDPYNLEKNIEKLEKEIKEKQDELKKIDDIEKVKEIQKEIYIKKKDLKFFKEIEKKENEGFDNLTKLLKGEL